MLTRALALLALLPISLTGQEVSPDTWYQARYVETRQCLERLDRVDRPVAYAHIRFYAFTPHEELPEERVMRLWGYHAGLRTGSIIFLRASRLRSEELVRHELIHALCTDCRHEKPVFSTCDGVFTPPEG